MRCFADSLFASVGVHSRSADSFRAAKICLNIVIVFALTLAAHAATNLEIIVTDAKTSDPLPCRVHLFHADGKPVKPAKLPFWRDHFVCDGTVELTISEAEFRYEIERGPEWGRAIGKFTSKSGEIFRLTEKLSRIADLPAEGWWSGETHVDSVGIAHNHLHRSGVLGNEAWGRPRDPVRHPGPHGNAHYTQEIWWHALNCGLALTPTAGSASGVLPNPVGYNRLYVQCDGELTWEKWWDGFRAGRVFVTNGPLLRVTANDQLPGTTLKTDGGPLKVHLAGRLDSRDPIVAVELVRNGHVERIQLPARVSIEENGWFLVRAVADLPDTYRFASTAPWYVEIGGQPSRPLRDSVQFFVDWTARRIAQIEQIADAEKREDVLRFWRETERFWQAKLAAAVPKQTLPAGGETRPAKDAAELQAWLENMMWHHRYTRAEMAAVIGLDERKVADALARFDIRSDNAPARPTGGPLLVLPYPGGRHPRIGFLEGAINPQRETKLSVFPPWSDGGYVCLDVPEAIWSNLGLTYLAHTHIDTIWTKQGLTLPRLEWERGEDGGYRIERVLPNGITFKVRAVPRPDHVELMMQLKNGTPSPLSDLRVQMCAMLKAARGFEAQTNENKVFEPPFAAVRDTTGRRWVIHAWQPIHRVWGNAPCPCLHADPKFPDCPPGETRELRGWVSFFEGAEVREEFRRIAKIWKPAGTN